MQITSDDIIIRIRIRDKHNLIDPKDLTVAFDLLEQCLYESDVQDVIEATNKLQLSRVVSDAAELRLRRYRNRRVKFYEAHTGSIEIVGLVAAVSYFVLESTVGEALKDGFRESKLYPGLKELFKSIFSDKPYRIVEFLRTKFVSNKLKGDVRIRPKTNNSPTEISVDLLTKEDKDSEQVRTIGEITDRR